MYKSVARRFCGPIASLLPFTGRDMAQQESFGEPIPLTGYAVDKHKLITSIRGEECLCKTELYVDDVVHNFEPDDLIEYGGTRYPILDYSIYRDRSGGNCVVIRI